MTFTNWKSKGKATPPTRILLYFLIFPLYIATEVFFGGRAVNFQGSACSVNALMWLWSTTVSPTPADAYATFLQIHFLQSLPVCSLRMLHMAVRVGLCYLLIYMRAEIAQSVKWRVTSWTAGIWFPTRTRDFSHLHSFEPVLGSSSLLPNGPGGPFPGGNAVEAWSWPLTSI
jgi:hypothetical protein